MNCVCKVCAGVYSVCGKVKVDPYDYICDECQGQLEINDILENMEEEKTKKPLIDDVEITTDSDGNKFRFSKGVLVPVNPPCIRKPVLMMSPGALVPQAYRTKFTVKLNPLFGAAIKVKS